MKYKYRTKENASKLLYAKNLPSLPSDISLAFIRAYIRFYKSREISGFFFCTFAVPAFKDDDGYVIEREFNDESGYDLSKYLVPCNDSDLDSLSKVVSCYFEDKTEMGRRMLLLNMKIKGTPFFGHVLIDSNLYVTARSAASGAI